MNLPSPDSRAAWRQQTRSQAAAPAARGLQTVLLLAALACLLWLASPTLAQPHDEGNKHEAGTPHEGGEAHPHEPNALEHVMDQTDKWEFFQTLNPHEWDLPEIPFTGRKLTKYMILEVIACVLIALIYIPLAQRLRDGRPPKGWFANTFEVLLTFVRNEIAKPNIGPDADRFVPFLWTLFLFILFNNLLGMLPFAASPTASIFATGALALIVFFAIHGCAIAKMGFGPYMASMWPHIDVPFPLGYVIKPFIFFIEWFGVLVRNIVLAIRLFANMFAGHMVLATILIFIYSAGVAGVSPALWGTVTVSSVLGILALSLLEIFVAFLQAYIFTFLASLFMGMAMHPAH
jgi:F-type H+-transporting ATPase subunit a